MQPRQCAAHRAIQAGLLGAVGVYRQRVVSYGETLGLGHCLLAPFNFRVIELFDPAAIKADQVIVVLAFVELIYRLARLKVAAVKQPGLLELRQHPINSRQAHIGALVKQHAKHVLRCHVALPAVLEYLQDFQARQGGLQAGAFEFVDVGHEGLSPVGAAEKGQLLRRRWVAMNGRAKYPAGTMKHHIAPPFFMPENTRIRTLAVVALVACAALAGCSSNRDPLTGKTSESKLNPANWITPYRVDVIQGNFVSKEQVAQLRAGMIRDQVKAILGTPLLASVFHADRWDYVFTLRRQGVASQSFRYTVYFKGDQLERFEGDTMPSETEFIAKLDTRRQLGKVPVLEATDEQLQAADKESASRAAAAKERSGAAAAPAPGGGAAASYPPLESPGQ